MTIDSGILSHLDSLIGDTNIDTFADRNALTDWTKYTPNLFVNIWPVTLNVANLGFNPLPPIVQGRRRTMSPVKENYEKI